MPNLTTLASVNPKRCLPGHLSLSDEVSFIPMADVTEGGEWLNHQTRRLKSVLSGFTPFVEGDVLFAKITPCTENGKGAQAVGLKNGVGFGSTEFHVLRAKEGVAPRFIYHLCQSRRLRLAAEQYMIGSAGQQRVQPGFFDHFNAPDLEKDEQSKVAQILDTLDIQIRQTEALIAKLETVKQGLLTDLLSRGIDENGQLRPPPEEAPGLYEDSPLGLMPKAWDVVKLQDVAHVKGGKRLPAGHDYVAEKTGFKYLRVTDFFERDYSLAALNNLSEATFNALGRYEIRPGELFISIAGSLGFVGVHRDGGFGNVRTILTENAARLVLKDDLVPEFLAAFMNGAMVQRQIEAEKGTGGGVPKLALFRIEHLWVALPNKDEQAVIVKRLRSVTNRIRKEAANLSKLESEKDGLMEDLLTGRIRVTELT